MTKYGYARVSTTDQDVAIQIDALKAAGCNVVRSEKKSGKSRANREELDLLLEFIQKDDVLVVTRIDRLARSIKDLQEIVIYLKSKGASLEATEQPVQTNSAAGKAFLDMLGVFAEFETNLRKERQLEGIDAAKKKGVYKGRKKTIDNEKIKRLKEEERLSVQEISNVMNISRMSVYRALKD